MGWSLPLHRIELSLLLRWLAIHCARNQSRVREALTRFSRLAGSDGGPRAGERPWKRAPGLLCRWMPRMNCLGVSVFVYKEKGAGLYILPSIHSSRQKNFKLCRSTPSPTYTPHILLVSMNRCFSSGVKSEPSTRSRKKSSRLLSGEIVSLWALLYSKASSMEAHKNSDILLATARLTGFPSAAMRSSSSSKSVVVVLVVSARVAIGLVPVPWIQLGPLQDVSVS